jgi:hypothetical protein
MLLEAWDDNWEVWLLLLLETWADEVGIWLLLVDDKEGEARDEEAMEEEADCVLNPDNAELVVEPVGDMLEADPDEDVDTESVPSELVGLVEVKLLVLCP